MNDQDTTGSTPPPDRPPRQSAHGEQPGDFIGAYKLLEAIGEGGFGVVWLAERREPFVQRVALKIIKPGMDSRAVIARFEQERQALAVMDHPNIAKVVDGGVTPASAGSRPYFVMEHVQGEPVTDYCDRHRLTMRQRLELFVPVCDAVQHAHMKGIIHRDLKPGNILVTVRDGQLVPKVIDFGVAKAISHALTDKTIFTEHGQIIGTPEYMSPEQAEMGAVDIDTRTDVYSLGVVLYELLTGLLPFDASELRRKGYAEIQRIIRDVDPPTPSKRLTTIAGEQAIDIAKKRQAEREEMAGELRHELEWLPLKAMRKDRTQRYATAKDLADDVQNYLSGRVLMAGPESAGYRIRKFARRYRVAFLAGGVAVASVLGGLGVSIGGFVSASRQRDRAVSAEHQQAALREEAESARVREALQRTKAEASAREAERRGYAALIAAADSAIRAGDVNLALQRLDETPPAERAWEYAYLRSQTDNSLRRLNADIKADGLTFSPDGKLIATINYGNPVALIDARTGAVTRELRFDISAEQPGDSARMRFEPPSFSADGSLLAAAGELEIQHENSFAPGDYVLFVWDVESGQLVRRIDDRFGGCRQALFLPSSKRLLILRKDGSLGTLDLSVNDSSVVPIDGIAKPLSSISISERPLRLATIDRSSTVQVWTLSDQFDFVSEPTESPAKGRRACLSSDSEWLAVTDSNVTRLVHLPDATVRQTIRVDEKRVWGTVFSPNAKYLATASIDGIGRLWELPDGKEAARLLGHGNVPLWGLAFHPNGGTVVTSSLSGVFEHAAGGTEPIARMWECEAGTVTSLCFIDEATLVSGQRDGTLTAWNTRTTELVAIRRVDQRAFRGGVMAAHRPGTSSVVVGDPTGRVAVYSLPGLESSEALCQSGKSIADVAVSSDGRFAAWMKSDGHLTTWSLERSRQTGDLEFRNAALSRNSGLERQVSLAFAPKGALVAVALRSSAEIAFVNCERGELIRTTLWEGVVGKAGRDIGGQQLGNITWGMDDSSLFCTSPRLRLLHPDSGEAGWTSLVTTDWWGSSPVVLHPDGRRLFVTPVEGTLAIVASDDGREVFRTTLGARSIVSLAVSPTGAQIAAGMDDGQLAVVSTATIASLSAEQVLARATQSIVQPRVRELRRANHEPKALDLALAADQSLTPEARKAGRRYASILPVSADDLNDDAWRKLIDPKRSRSDVEHALEMAEHAVALAPDSAAYANTLALARYRARQYEASIAMANRSRQLDVAAGRDISPIDFAIIAMSHHNLGRADDARAALAKLRELMQDLKHKNDQQSQAFLREAVELIDGGGTAESK